MTRIRVAVLMGGTSSERAISLSTGNQIVAALNPARYDVVALDSAVLFGQPFPALPREARELPAMQGAEMAPVGLAELSSPRSPFRPDVVFIALHGKGGEDGTIQGALELLRIPYTGSGVLASALAMDKQRAKKLLRSEGIPVPQDLAVGRGDPLLNLHERVEAAFGYPIIVKPNQGGSTLGCARVSEEEELEPAVLAALEHDEIALIEELIPGTEITAGLLGSAGPEVLPLIEIVAEGGFYDYEAKYAPGGSQHIIPARISSRAAERARRYAVRSHTALGCRGMSRVDMMVDGDQPYVLEVNTIPGMTPTSLLPDAAREAGIEFSELLDRIIHEAIHREG